MTEEFERLIEDGLQLAFAGWDFSAVGERWVSQKPPWDYTALLRQRLPGIDALLDMDTGGGELLASLAPLPPDTWATEGYVPNIPEARGRLGPLGVHVVDAISDQPLPFPENRFDLVANRHGSFSGRELFRILRPGGLFLTQQVGGQDNFRLNELLQDQPKYEFGDWTLEAMIQELTAGGLEILSSQEAFPEERFYDIGAVVFYLRIIQWQIADFSIEKYRPRLFALHEQIQRDGCLVTHGHRVLIEARRPPLA